MTDSPRHRARAVSAPRLSSVIDSHTHLFLCDGTEAELVAAAREAGVSRMLTVGMDAETNAAAIAAAERHEGVFAAVGSHPNEATGFDEAAAAEIVRLGAHEKVRAIGETGLDYYRDSAPPDEQRRAFAAQIEIARELDLPIVIHARDPEGGSEAVDEIFATLDARPAGRPVILHCFSAPLRVADAAERGWHCSFAGNVTYPRVGGAAGRGSGGSRGPDPGRDRRPLPDPAGQARCPQRAGQRRRHRPCGGRRPVASPTRSWSGRSRPMPARSSAGSEPWSGSARTSSPIPTCSTRSSATPSSRRTTWCSRSGRGRGC